MTAKEINGLIKDGPKMGRNVYLIPVDVSDDPVRIIAAKKKENVLFVKSLSSGKWLKVGEKDEVSSGRVFAA